MEDWSFLKLMPMLGMGEECLKIKSTEKKYFKRKVKIWWEGRIIYSRARKIKRYFLKNILKGDDLFKSTCHWRLMIKLVLCKYTLGLLLSHCKTVKELLYLIIKNLLLYPLFRFRAHSAMRQKIVSNLIYLYILCPIGFKFEGENFLKPSIT